MQTQEPDGSWIGVSDEADPRLANTPVVMMTAHSDPALPDRSLRKGVALTLAKPVDFDRLLTLVRFAE